MVAGLGFFGYTKVQKTRTLANVGKSKDLPFPCEMIPFFSILKQREPGYYALFLLFSCVFHMLKTFSTLWRKEGKMLII
jgi:hypothetical protein